MWILADVFPGPALVLVGGGIFLALEVAVTLGESVILWLMKWGSYPRSLLDAMVMNVTSGFLGTFVSLLLLPSLVIAPALGPKQSLAVVLFIHGGLTLLLETGVLLALRRRPLRKTFAVAMGANLVSYSCLSLVIVALAFDS
jgi:hypothetical protein